MVSLSSLHEVSQAVSKGAVTFSILAQGRKQVEDSIRDTQSKIGYPAYARKLE